MKNLILHFALFFLPYLGFSQIDSGFVEIKPDRTFWTIAWSPDGKYLAAGGDDTGLKIFETENFKLIKTFPIEDVTISRVKWHPVKNLLAVVTQSKTFKAKILNLDKDEWIELQGLPHSLRALDWNHDGSYLAVSHLGRDVSVFSNSGDFVSTFQADNKGVTGLDWHPEKNIMVTVGSQIGVHGIMGDTLNSFVPRKDEETFMLCVEWHPSGDFYAVGDYGNLEFAKNKLIQFWNLDGEKLNDLTGSIGEYRNIRWDGNGEKLASASDALRIWSKDGKLLHQSESTEDYLWGIDWSPDGKFIIASSSKGKIVLRDSEANFIREIEY